MTLPPFAFHRFTGSVKGKEAFTCRIASRASTIFHPKIDLTPLIPLSVDGEGGTRLRRVGERLNHRRNWIYSDYGIINRYSCQKTIDGAQSSIV